MPHVEQIYVWLTEEPSPVCDQILGEALDHAEPEWRERIVRVLTTRNREESWLSLIGHYSCVQAIIDPLIDTNQESAHAGITKALSSPLPDERLNALRAIQRHPASSVVIHVADMLRDTVPAIRSAAAETLRAIAESALRIQETSAEITPDSIVSVNTPPTLVQTLRDELRNYARHNCAEIIEVALWLARDLGDAFMETCAAPYSPIGRVVRSRLAAWDHPRLAYFLVRALKYRDLRPIAGKLLRNWRGVEQISALLFQTDLLEDPEIRGRLRAFKNPAWFADFDDDLRQLPPHLRSLAPRWECLIEAGEPERSTSPEPRRYAADNRPGPATGVPVGSARPTADVLSQAAQAAHDSAQRALRRTVELLSAGEFKEEDADLAQGFHELLHAVYPGENASQRPESGEKS